MNAILLLAALLLSPWASEKNTIAVEHGEADTWTFRHTGTKNWCVNITDRLSVRPGERYALACSTESVGMKARFAMTVCLFAADGTAVDWFFSPVSLKPGRRTATSFTIPAGVVKLYVRFRRDSTASTTIRRRWMRRPVAISPDRISPAWRRLSSSTATRCVRPCGRE